MMVRWMAAGSIMARWRLLLLAPVAALLLGCTAPPDGVTPVADFDTSRYLGQWYEIARLDHRFERGLANVTAQYEANADGTLRVINRGLERGTCQWKQAEGKARFLGAPSIASLSVTFFWPFSGGYHVFALDRQDYAWAMVSGPSREYLWILARRPELDADTQARLIEQARALGFETAALIMVDQSTPPCAPAFPAQ